MRDSQRLRKIHEEALKRFDAIYSVVRDERQQNLEDRRFYSIAGAQWEGSLGEQFANKPRLEVNKVHLAVLRIINEYRNNRVTVDFVPSGKAKNDTLADTLDGLYRADEQDSVADEAYDNAFEEAASGGLGAWRLRACYEDEYDADDDRQRVRIEPITDAESSVFFDLAAKRQDKADAKYAFVLQAIPRDDYVEMYGDDPAAWPRDVASTSFDWATPDVVFVAEYYAVTEVAATKVTFQALTGEEESYDLSELEEDEGEKADELAALGYREVKRKKYKTRAVHKHILSGSKVLEDCGRIAGKCIPLVVTYGKRWVVDGIERSMGHVRLAKDAQRLKNMQLSKLAEISALSSIEKPILLPEQIAGHQMMWAEDNVKDYPYLLVNTITGPDGSQVASGPVGYTKSPAIPPAMAALLQVTETDMQDILGSAQQADKMVSNISGEAVEMIQQRLDMQTFIYMSNFSRAMKRSGEIWISMAQELYSYDKRTMKTVAADGKVGMVELMTPTLSADGELEYENDLSTAKIDVVTTVGPSSSSKRAATVRALTGMLAITQDPESAQVLQSMAVLNMEGEGLSDVRDFFRQRLLRMGAVKPTKEEAEQLQSQMQAAGAQQDPNAVFLQAAAEEATAKATKARADVINTIADAEYKRAKTAETMAGIDIAEAEATMNGMSKMHEAVYGRQNQRNAT